MLYCLTCGDITDLNQKEVGKCPKCEAFARELSSPKLVEILVELSDAVYAATKSSNNPKALVDIGNTIDKGERKLQKEFSKRREQKADIDFELQVIEKFAKRMRYDLEVKAEVKQDVPTISE